MDLHRTSLAALLVSAIVISLARSGATAAEGFGEAHGASLATSSPIVISPLTWSVVAGPVFPVRGTDGRFHVAYELLVGNVSQDTVRIRAVEFIDPEHDDRVVTHNDVVEVLNADVSQVLRLLAAPPSDAPLTKADYSDRLEPGRSGLLYVDLAFANRRDVPRAIAHRVTMSSLIPASSAAPASETAPQTATGALLEISDQRPIVLSPPLRGAGWLDGSGCCRIVGPHRYTLLPIAGALRPAEHFAIDFVQLDTQGRMFVGDPRDLRSWPYYGADVVSAAPGTVVEVRDDLRDLVPGMLPDDITADEAAGNHVIVNMGDGRFALYAHLVPKSIPVRVGQRVVRGQLLGKLGNSGNTDSPHLHFQVMNTASALETTGLPFVFDRMTLQARVLGPLDDVNQLTHTGAPATLDRSQAGPHNQQMPLTLDVLDF